MNLEVTTCNHLGDALCLSAALANLRRVKPDWRVWYAGNYGEIYHGTEFWRPDDRPPTRTIHCEYRDFGTTDRTAQGGSLCDGLTLSLARHLGVDIPAVVHAPRLHITEPEREWACETLGDMAILLNTNCQIRSSVKAYPWWSEVCAMLPEFRIFLTGGRESRDIRDNSRFPANVTDLRGRTTFRQLLALAGVCMCAVTPPSSLCHAAAAFGTPTVIVSGAREPVALTDYPNAWHITSVCLPARHALRYDRACGCIHFRTDDARSCEHAVAISGRNYAMCMACIDPHAIAAAVRRHAKQLPTH